MPVAGVTEWTKVADSRSAPVGVRGFESCPPHMIIEVHSPNPPVFTLIVS